MKSHIKGERSQVKQEDDGNNIPASLIDGSGRMRYLMMYRMIKDHVEHHLELPYHYPMYVGTIHPNLCVGIKQTNQKPLIHVPGKKVKFIFHNGDGIHCCCLLRIACRYFYMRYLHLSTFRGSDKCLRAPVTANENKPELDCVISIPFKFSLLQ